MMRIQYQMQKSQVAKNGQDARTLPNPYDNAVNCECGG
jgi:hypothetical protein